MPSLRHTSGINCDKNAKRYLNSRLQSSLINIACFWLFISASKAGPRSAVSNVSGYRYVSDCRSRGREFDQGPVPYCRGD